MSDRTPERPWREVRIEAIGAGGDGVARLGDGSAYVPFTVPGDLVRIRPDGRRGGAIAAELVELVEAGAARAVPPCPHFGVCGGCALQHVAEDVYARWKRETVTLALARRGLQAAVEPLLRIPPGRRRRATFVARRDRSGVRLGFHGRGTHAVVDLRTCLILLPELVHLLDPLRDALGSVLRPGETAAAAVALTDSGADILLGWPGTLDLAGRERLAVMADELNLARLSHSSRGGPAEPLALRRTPRILFGGVAVELPPGGFLQPSAAGEAALVERALAALAGCRAVADLFSGIGAFTFPLAAGSRIHAVEGDAAAIAALGRAVRTAELAGRISTERRDLARDPLPADALDRFDGALFDPPRAGARAQAAALAASRVPVVVAVSCDAATFARDARILVDGGYRLGPVAAIDQFPWSPHVELLAVLRR